MEAMQRNAATLAGRLESVGNFELTGEDEEQPPLVAFKLAEEGPYDESDIAWQLSAERGWMVPPTRCHQTPETVKIHAAPSSRRPWAASR